MTSDDDDAIQLEPVLWCLRYVVTRGCYQLEFAITLKILRKMILLVIVLLTFSLILRKLCLGNPFLHVGVPNGCRFEDEVLMVITVGYGNSRVNKGDSG